MRWIRLRQRALTALAPHNANPSPAALVPIKRVGLANIENPLAGRMQIGQNVGGTYWGFFEGPGPFGSWGAGHLYQLTGQTSGQVTVIFDGKVQPHPTRILVADETAPGTPVQLNWNGTMRGYAAVNATLATRWQGLIGSPLWVTVSW